MTALLPTVYVLALLATMAPSVSLTKVPVPSAPALLLTTALGAMPAIKLFAAGLNE